MYVCGLVIPVPENAIDAYRSWAEKGAAFFKEYGCLEIVESWEDFVPDGKQTDFRRSVAIEDGEKVVFSWLVWPDKATADAGHEKMMADPRMKDMDMANMPFDGKRMIHGGFEAIVSHGRR